MGKIFVVEGSDGSGKKTQTDELYKRLLDEGHKVKKLEFPNYESDSSALVKMYLNGEFGTNPNDVNCYAASTFYAVDRFASYVKDWKKIYEEKDSILIADRYTTSNAVHQTCKIEDNYKKEMFLNWLWDLEYVKMGIPKPDTVIFLDMPVGVSLKLMKERANKITNETKKDIHESHAEFLKKSYDNALWLVKKYNWNKINCSVNGQPRTIENIHDDIYNVVKKFL